MDVQNPLGLIENPFGPADEAAGTGLSSSLLTACDDVLASIRDREPLTILVGKAGFGKTLLLDIVEHRCASDGLKILRIARGDMAHAALGADADLLLIDEADSIIDSTLAALAPGAENAAAPMMIFACVRPRLHRIPGGVRPALVELLPLDARESRAFLQARLTAVGRPELFEPEALDAIVRAGRGSPRLLRVLAGAALSQAINDGVARVGREHADYAVAQQHELQPDAAPVETPAVTDEGSAPQSIAPPLPRPASRTRRSSRRKRDLVPLAASVALMALVLPTLFSGEAPVGPTGAPSSATAAGTPPIARLAAPFVASAARATPNFVLRPEARRLALADTPVAGTPVLASLSRPAAEPVLRAAQLPVSQELRDVVRSEIAVQPIEMPPLEVVAAPGRMLIVDVLAATRPQAPAFAALRRNDARASAQVEAVLASQPAPAAVPPLLAAVPAAIVKPAVVTDAADQARAAKQASETASAAQQAAEQAAAARQAAEQAKAAKDAADQAKSAKEAAEQAKATKEAADQAKAAKDAADQAKAAKEAAEQSKAAKDAADKAREAKEAAAQAQAAKDAAAQAKAAKDSADQAKAAKDAADQAKAAKEAAEKAKEAKAAAEQAKAAKDAADQAKAAKEAADQAKAAKEAADQAQAAKDAAEQARAAKDAAAQAKAAKEAAEQAKAAKEAAEQAKAAKEAADQAQAAKEAAEQAKAAKEAADQAKAAKEAAEQAKAAKDAAAQAKDAKEAAQAAKDAKDAAREAKEAKDAAKDAKEAAKAAKDASKSGKGG